MGHPALGSDGAGWQADLGCLSFLLKEFYGAFFPPRPKLTSSHVPRPGAHVWDEHGSYRAVPNNGIGDILELSGAGCEFGACGFQQSGNVPNVSVNCRGIETYHLGLILAQHCDATV